MWSLPIFLYSYQKEEEGGKGPTLDHYRKKNEGSVALDKKMVRILPLIGKKSKVKQLLGPCDPDKVPRSLGLQL